MHLLTLVFCMSEFHLVAFLCFLTVHVLSAPGQYNYIVCKTMYQ